MRKLTSARRASGIRWRRKGPRGVSDVVATILLLALTVTLFASIFAWVTTFPSPTPQNNNQFRASLVYTSNGINISAVQITHLAGPSVPGTALVYLKSAVQPSAPEFASPYTVASQSLAYATVAGFSTWNLGQTWVVTFTNTPADLPSSLGNITVYVVSASQLLFSVILPGAATSVAPTVISTWTVPATPGIGQAFTVNATLGGNYNPLWVYVNLASLHGASGTAEARMTQNSQGVWGFKVNAGNTSSVTAGTYYGFVNTSSVIGQGATGAVVITIAAAGSGGSGGALSVGVVFVPSPPNSGTTESVQAVVTYTTASAALALSVTFTGTTTGAAACGSYSGSSPSGLTITGPSSVTVVSQTAWTIPTPNSLCPYTFSATATVGTLTPVTGTTMFTPALITVSTGSVGVGGTNVVTGQAFAPSTGVNLTVGGVSVTPTFTASSGTCPELGTTGAILTSTSGGFTCTITVPPLATHGSVSIVATDSASGQLDSATFTVTAATLSFSPTTGDVGGTTTATGSGFAFSKSISFTLDGASATSSCTSTGTGTFSCSVTVPAVPAGAQTAVASDGTDTASSTYTVFLDPTVAVSSSANPVYYDIAQTATALTATTTYSGPNTASLAWYSGTSLTCSADTTATGITTTTYTPTITATGTTDYCVRVADSGVTGYTGYSNVITVTVSSTLTAPATPTFTTSGTTQTITGIILGTGTPTYSWTWLVQTGGSGAYSAATQCSVNSGKGAIGGTSVTCAATGLSTTTKYSWELQVTDSATTPATVTSTGTTATDGMPNGGGGALVSHSVALSAAGELSARAATTGTAALAATTGSRRS